MVVDITKMTAEEVKKACTDLQGSWRKRGDKMKAWYKIISLKSDKKEENMEDVVSNDPRTAYNLALHLLTSSVVSHTIPTEGLESDAIVAAGKMRLVFDKLWRDVERDYRYRGRQSWKRELVGTMLSTGWYAVLALPTKDGLAAEIWHPAETFQEFSDDGLVQCAHIYPLTASVANRKAALRGWDKLPGYKPADGNTKFYDLYQMSPSGHVINGSVLGDFLVKPMTEDHNLTKIPVLTSPISGLTERGTLTDGDAWQENYGEAICAVNEGINNNYNDMLTFIQQIMRDTATPRWFERSQGEQPIMKQADLFKRGAIFRGGINDDIHALDTPVVPVELQSIIFNYQNMKQRAEFPYVLYGNLQQQLAGYAISQIASAAMQVVTPYHDAVKAVLTDVDNIWLNALVNKLTTIANIKMPAGFPKDSEFEVDYTIEIPGYLTQRATLARMLNPTFELSTSRIMAMLFPEIKDSTKEMAAVNADKAKQSEVSVTISNIRAYQRMADEARKAKDEKTAQLYEKASALLESMITGKQPAKSNQQQKATRVSRSVAPAEETQPVPGIAEQAASGAESEA